jgi:hypothetical protein
MIIIAITAVNNILYPLINPVLEQLTELAHTHVVVMDDLRGRVPKAEHTSIGWPQQTRLQIAQTTDG